MSPEWHETLLRILLGISFRAVIVAVTVAFILRALRIRSNGVRHAAWTTVLLAMLSMPILSTLSPPIPLPIPAAVIRVEATNPSAATGPSANLGTDAESASKLRAEHAASADPEPKPLWPTAGIVLYCMVAILLFIRTLWGWRSMLRIARDCRPVPWKAVVPARLPAAASVFESKTVAAPLTAGILSPRVILPGGWREWPVGKLTAVLAHEFSHVRRRDMLVALLSRLNCCLYWFNPLSWWLERKLASTAELASDDDAVHTLGETKLYAEVLLDMAEAVHRQGRRFAPQGVGVSGNGFLDRRIDRLLGGNPFYKTSGIRKIVLAIGCAATIFLVAACRKPSNLQEDRQIMAQKTRPTPPASFWAKRVRIMTDPVNPPFEFGKDTGVQGLDVVIGNEIAKTVGIAAKWVKAPGPAYSQNRLKRVVDALLGGTPGTDSLSDSEQLFDLLKKGKAEMVISAVAIDPAKSADFEFSQPYYETGDIIAYRRDRSDITDLASLSGKIVGVTAGRHADAFMAAQKTAAGVVIKRFSTIDDSLGALNRGEMDAVVGDEPLVTYSSVKSFHNTTTQPTLISQYEYGVVVKRGKRDLLAKINSTINRLKTSGELKKLEEAWLAEVRYLAYNLRLQDQEIGRSKNKSLSAAVSIK